MNKETKPKKPRDKKNLLFGRIEIIKPLLPKDWRKRLVEKDAEYDRLEMADFIRNVHSLRVADESLTLILEQIASEYQAELQKANARMEKVIKRQKLISV